MSVNFVVSWPAVQFNYCTIDSVRTSVALISQLRWINADRLTSLGPMERPDYVCDADGMDFFLESKPDAEYNARDEDIFVIRVKYVMSSLLARWKLQTGAMERLAREPILHTKFAG